MKKKNQSDQDKKRGDHIRVKMGRSGQKIGKQQQKKGVQVSLSFPHDDQHGHHVGKQKVEQSSAIYAGMEYLFKDPEKDERQRGVQLFVASEQVQVWKKTVNKTALMYLLLDLVVCTVLVLKAKIASDVS